MSKRGRQQGRQDQRYEGRMSGPRQSPNQMPYQSNDWSRNRSTDWNDGGLGGSQNYPGGSQQYSGYEGQDRPRHFTGDDTRFERRESYSGNWETDDGRATYGAGQGT